MLDPKALRSSLEWLAKTLESTACGTYKLFVFGATFLTRSSVTFDIVAIASFEI